MSQLLLLHSVRADPTDSPPPPTPVQHMRVDHRRAHIFVAEQFLNRADVVASFKERRGKGVAVTIIILPMNYPS